VSFVYRIWPLWCFICLIIWTSASEAILAPYSRCLCIDKFWLFLYDLLYTYIDLLITWLTFWSCYTRGQEHVRQRGLFNRTRMFGTVKGTLHRLFKTAKQRVRSISSALDSTTLLATYRDIGAGWVDRGLVHAITAPHRASHIMISTVTAQVCSIIANRTCNMTLTMVTVFVSAAR